MLWQRVINQIERVSKVYTSTAKVISLGLSDRVREDALKAAMACTARDGVVVADIGAGPGDSVLAAEKLIKPAYIACFDPSVKLLSICRSRVNPVLYDAVVAVSEHLPVRDNAADIASSFYAARDFKNLHQGLREMVRIASSTVVIGDIFLPRKPPMRQVVRTWVCGLTPLLVSLVAPGYADDYRGLCDTLKGWSSIEELASLLENYTPLVIMHSYALGGLGYVLACKGLSSVNGCKRDSVRSKARRGAPREGHA